MDVEVEITVTVKIRVPHHASEKEMQETAWFDLFDNNDPSNWPSNTKFDCRIIGENL